MKNRIKKALTKMLTRDEVETAVHDIALSIANRRKLEANLNERRLALEQEYAPGFAVIDKAVEEKTAQVQAWAEANPDEFAKRKSITFVGGVVGFRTGTPKLALLNRSWNWEKVLDAVCQHLPNFIRSKPEIDKEAIIGQWPELEQYSTLVGMKLVQEEKFFIEPDLIESDARQVQASPAPIKKAA